MIFFCQLVRFLPDTFSPFFPGGVIELIITVEPVLIGDLKTGSSHAIPDVDDISCVYIAGSRSAFYGLKGAGTKKRHLAVFFQRQHVVFIFQKDKSFRSRHTGDLSVCDLIWTLSDVLCSGSFYRSHSYFLSYKCVTLVDSIVTDRMQLFNAFFLHLLYLSAVQNVSGWSEEPHPFAV